MNKSKILTIIAFIVLVVIVLLSILGLLFAGYLFNYYMIKELRETNKCLQDLSDIIGVNLSRMTQQPARQSYQMKSNNDGGQINEG